MATTVGPEDLRPGDRIEVGGRQVTVREVREGQPGVTGIRVFRVLAEPDGDLNCTLYTGDEVTRIDSMPD